MSKLSVRGLRRPYAIEPITSVRLAVLFPVGQRVRGRLIAKLEEEKYLLRLKGHYFVARSSFPFDEGSQITAVVKNTWPRLHLQLQAKDVNNAKAKNSTDNASSDNENDVDALRRGFGKLPFQVDIHI